MLLTNHYIVCTYYNFVIRKDRDKRFVRRTSCLRINKGSHVRRKHKHSTCAQHMRRPSPRSDWIQLFVYPLTKNIYFLLCWCMCLGDAFACVVPVHTYDITTQAEEDWNSSFSLLLLLASPRFLFLCLYLRCTCEPALTAKPTRNGASFTEYLTTKNISIFRHLGSLHWKWAR